MNRLDVGMYVRTLTLSGISKIGKLQKIDDICITDNGAVDKTQIIKFSHNIIDLIEVGDYVNGCYVSNKRASVNEHLGGHPKGVGIIKCNAYFNQGNYNDCRFVWIEEKDIKTIVTKEMFANAEYKVEE